MQGAKLGEDEVRGAKLGEDEVQGAKLGEDEELRKLGVRCSAALGANCD